MSDFCWTCQPTQCPILQELIMLLQTSAQDQLARPVCLMIMPVRIGTGFNLTNCWPSGQSAIDIRCTCCDFSSKLKLEIVWVNILVAVSRYITRLKKKTIRGKIPYVSHAVTLITEIKQCCNTGHRNKTIL